MKTATEEDQRGIELLHAPKNSSIFSLHWKKSARTFAIAGVFREPQEENPSASRGAAGNFHLG
jgi:hypothetical protein